MIEIIDLLFTIVLVLLLIRLILEIVSARRGHPIVAFIFSVTEPIVRPFHGMIRSSRSGIVATVLALIAVIVVKYIVLALLETVLPRGKRG